MKMKKVAVLLSTIILSLGLLGCGGDKNEAGDTQNKDNKKKIVVGASPTPHAEILKVAKEELKKEGYELEIQPFTDYQIPNRALEEKQLDANYFQHIPFLEEAVKQKGYKLTYTEKVHIEPMGLYSKKIKKVEEVKSGAEIAIPNDPANGGRALRVLESAGIIKLKDGELVTKLDITENKKNIKVTEVDAAQLPRILDDVDAAVINTNYAIEASLNPLKDAIVIESKDSPYVNILAIREEDREKDYIKALSKALTSEKVKKFIEEKYDGNIIPVF
nr:MetQ/NlpA family ABC transporter substrate-binding protein [Clostridium tetani]